MLEGAAALAAVAAPAAAVALWLRPIAKQTASVDPSKDELQRALVHYKGQLDVLAGGSYRLAPELFGRSGAIAVMALFAVPLAVFGARRRWGAFVLGGFLAVLLLTLVPTLFMHFADVVSISQARRVAGFVPFPFAIAGAAAVLARLLSVGALFVGLGAGIAFQLAYPGDFGYALGEGGPAAATWVALFGGGAALVVAIFLPRRFGELDRHGLDRGGHGRARDPARSRCTASRTGTRSPCAAPGLTAGLVRALRTEVPKKAVVFSDDTTSYAIAAFAPVYVAQRLAGSRRRHEGEPAVRAARRRRGVPPHAATWRSRGATAPPGSSSTASATPSSGSTSAEPTRTATRSTAARLDAVNTAQQRALGALRDDGIAVLPFTDLFAEELWDDLRADMQGFVRESEAVAAEAGPAPKKKNDIILRRFRQVTKSGGEKPTFALDDPTLRIGCSDTLLEVVNAYRDARTKLYYADNWFTVPYPEADGRVASQVWHRDPEEEHVVKVFLYVDEVDEGRGPFEYVRSSAPGGRYGHLWPWKEGEGIRPPTTASSRRSRPRTACSAPARRGR